MGKFEEVFIEARDSRIACDAKRDLDMSPRRPVIDKQPGQPASHTQNVLSPVTAALRQTGPDQLPTSKIDNNPSNRLVIDLLNLSTFLKGLPDTLSLLQSPLLLGFEILASANLQYHCRAIELTSDYLSTPLP